MTQYVKHHANLSKLQQRNLVKAIHSKSPFSMKLTYDNLHGEHDIFLTPRQLKKLEKAYSNGKGVVIKMSARQLAHTGKQSGFILPLLASLAGSFLPGLVKTGVDFVSKSISGKGADTDDFNVSKRGQGIQRRGEKDGGFIGPLIAGLASGVLGNLLGDAVNKGVREKAGVGMTAPGGAGLAQLGRGAWNPAIMAISRDAFRNAGKPIPQELQGDFLPDRPSGRGLVQLGRGKKKASGLAQLGVYDLRRGRGQNLRALQGANSMQVI